jgi:hypothetical protein
MEKQTIGEYFKDLTIAKLTMDQYERLKDGDEFVADNFLRDDRDLDHVVARSGIARGTHDEDWLIEKGGELQQYADAEGEALARLLLISGEVIKEFAGQPYIGPYTHVMIMETAMKRLKHRHKENAPPGWVPVITRLRTFAEMHGKAPK